MSRCKARKSPPCGGRGGNEAYIRVCRLTRLAAQRHLKVINDRWAFFNSLLRQDREKGKKMSASKMRVMVAQLGLDTHNCDTVTIARCFSYAGFDVVYIGCGKTPGQVAVSAIQEDVDVLYLRCFSDHNRHLFHDIVKRLKDEGADHIKVIGNGAGDKQFFQLINEASLDSICNPVASMDGIFERFTENMQPQA